MDGLAAVLFFMDFFSRTTCQGWGFYRQSYRRFKKVELIGGEGKHVQPGPRIAVYSGV